MSPVAVFWGGQTLLISHPMDSSGKLETQIFLWALLFLDVTDDFKFNT